MSRIFIDGFEAKDTRHGLWDYSSHRANSDDSNPPDFIDADSAGTDTYSWFAGDNGRLRKYIDTTDELYFGFDYWITETISSGDCAVLLAVYEDSLYDRTPSFAVTVDSQGYIRAVNTKQDERIGISSDPIFDEVDAAKHVDIRIKSAEDPDGRFEIRVDESTVIDESGDSILNEGTFEVLEIGRVSGISSITDYEIVGGGAYDNFVIDDAEFPGVSKIQMINPNGAGNSSQWTPSSGDNYECVDDAPPDFSDYVETNTIDDQDLYSLSDLPDSPGSIKCVQVETSIRTLGNPDPQHIAHVLRLNSTDYQGDDVAIPNPSASDEGGYKTLQTIWEDNPDTDEAFTESEINDMEAGVKATA